MAKEPDKKEHDDRTAKSKTDSTIPNLSDLKSKFDLDKILAGIKSMLGTEGVPADVDTSDALGMKIVQISALIQEIAKTHASLSKDFSKVNSLLMSAFKDIEQIRADQSGKEPPA